VVSPRRATPGGQARYSTLAIELVLMLRLVFHLALRQAAGFVSSVFRLLGLALPIPEHTTLSRRGSDFAHRRPRPVPHGPLHLLIDSSGLKLFGRGEWDSERHRRTRRSWRKLHLVVNAETSEIVASVLTGNDAHDAGQVPVLLEQIEGEIASVMADGAYDGEPVYRAIQARRSGAAPTMQPHPFRAFHSSRNRLFLLHSRFRPVNPEPLGQARRHRPHEVGGVTVKPIHETRKIQGLL
jgi:Transposase DDE domain